MRQSWSVLVTRNESKEPNTELHIASIENLTEEDAMTKAHALVDTAFTENVSLYVKNVLTHTFLTPEGRRTSIGLDWKNPTIQDTNPVTIALVEDRNTGILSVYRTFDDPETAEEQLAQRAPYLYTNKDLDITYHTVDSLKPYDEVNPVNNDEPVWVMVLKDLEKPRYGKPEEPTIMGFFKSEMDIYKNAEFLMYDLCYNNEFAFMHLVRVKSF